MNNEHEESQGLISVLSDRLLNGLFKENPTFVLLLGMCPTLAVTTSAANGLGMGVTTMVVLAMSNLIISALRKIIPNKVRIPAFIVIIASFVTIVELLLKAYITSLYDALGIYIPLIVVNCIILGRAESYAYSHPVLPSLFDGIGMGMGFSVALTIIGGIREILGSGKLFGATIMPEGFVPVSIFVMAPGAFFVLALLTAIQNVVKDIGTKKGLDMSKIQSGCGGNCMECNKDCKSGGDLPTYAKTETVKAKEPSTKEEKKTSKDKKQIDVKSSADGLIGKIKDIIPKKDSRGVSEAEAQNNETVAVEKNDTIKTDIEKTEKPEKVVKEKKVREKTKSSKDDTVTEQPSKADTEIEKKEKDDKSKAPKLDKSRKTVKETKTSIKAEEVNSVNEPEAETEISEAKPTETEESVPERKDVYKVDEASLAPDDEDELELIDLYSLKSASSKTTVTGKKPGKKANAREKAKAMLFKAEESVKEDDND